MNEDIVTWNGIRTFEWCGYEWIARPLWGDHHPEEKLCWFDQDAYEILDDGTLILKITNNPRIFNQEDGTKIMKPWGKCHVRTTKEFKYGTFEWDMRLPYGRQMWPALWFASDTSWPPEIDCMEGWSKNTTNYVKRLLWKNIHPTMHWSANCDPEHGEHRHEEKFNTLRCWLKGEGKFDHYKTIWTPDYVEIWYNNHKIKRFTDKEMLEHMNKVNFHAIMSSNINDEFNDEMYEEYKEKNIEMAVRNFKYTPLWK